MAASTVLRVVSDESEVIRKLCLKISERANQAIQKRDVFTIGLSGGSLVKFLVRGLPTLATEWSKWRFFFCDERVVPFEDPESTFGCYRRELIGHIPVTEKQFVIVRTELDAEQAAKDYEQQLRQYFPKQEWPCFDVLLLGMGPDGHTCSLFPGHPLLDQKEQWAASIVDSPKPPPSRVTMTFPVLNNSACVIFAVTGASKAQVMKQILEGSGEDPLPAGRVRPKKGDLIWILDSGAASLLHKTTIS